MAGTILAGETAVGVASPAIQQAAVGYDVKWYKWIAFTVAGMPSLLRLKSTIR